MKFLACGRFVDGDKFDYAADYAAAAAAAAEDVDDEDHGDNDNKNVFLMPILSHVAGL